MMKILIKIYFLPVLLLGVPVAGLANDCLGSNNSKKTLTCYQSLIKQARQKSIKQFDEAYQKGAKQASSESYSTRQSQHNENKTKQFTPSSSNDRILERPNIFR